MDWHGKNMYEYLHASTTDMNTSVDCVHDESID